MFAISLEAAGKKYYRQWIFRNLSTSFSSNEKAVVLGANGSGKSTFLQMLSGAITPNEGKIKFISQNQFIDPENVYRYFSIAAPYLELIEEFTLRELIDLHFNFKKIISGLNKDLLIEMSGLKKAEHRQYRYFSSGMKQRVRLLLAICSDTPLLLLDEPCSNLDQLAVEWYSDLISRYTSNRLVIVASNHQKNEYSFCTRELNIADFKYEKATI